MKASSTKCLLYLVVVAAISIPVFAEGSRDRTQFGHEIIVGADENATEVTCFSCNVRIQGHVSGDVTTFGGSVVIEQDGEVAGDTTVFAGDLRLESGARVREVTVFGGKLRRDPSATVRGDITTFGGGVALWLFVIFGLPFVVLGAFIALIVWLVRRFSRPSVAMAPPAQTVSPAARAEGLPHS
jgi:hypothetical protein